MQAGGTGSSTSAHIPPRFQWRAISSNIQQQNEDFERQIGSGNTADDPIAVRAPEEEGCAEIVDDVDEDIMPWTPDTFTVYTTAPSPTPAQSDSDLSRPGSPSFSLRPLGSPQEGPVACTSPTSTVDDELYPAGPSTYTPPTTEPLSYFPYSAGDDAPRRGTVSKPRLPKKRQRDEARPVPPVQLPPIYSEQKPNVYEITVNTISLGIVKSTSQRKTFTRIDSESLNPLTVPIIIGDLVPAPGDLYWHMHASGHQYWIRMRDGTWKVGAIGTLHPVLRRRRLQHDNPGIARMEKAQGKGPTWILDTSLPVPKRHRAQQPAAANLAMDTAQP